MRLWLLGLFICATPVQAMRLQLLHTNDLHSFFEGTRDGLGGYARLKTLVDQLKSKARSQNTHTLFLDGGDFAEGASFFFADKGAESLRMIDRLGVDVTVIGNHDTLQGGAGLLDQIKRSGVKADILSANLNENLTRVLASKVKPMVVKNIGGIKIGIAGFTTSQLHYQYAVRDEGKILSPYSKISSIESAAKDENVDFLIALNHLGLKRDKEFASRTQDFDLIVGAHSHTRLDAPFMVKNKRGNKIPIIQASAHSIALGEMILEISPGRKPKIIFYKLHTIDSKIKSNPELHKHVQEAKVKREEYFGRSWDEPIGSTTFSLHGQVLGKNPTKASCWGKHIAQFTREAVGADVGIHASGFTGDTIPRGNLSFGDLIDSYPHFRSFGDGGWTISTATIPGLMMKGFISALKLNKDQFGMDYSLSSNKLNAFEKDEPVVVAFPSEIWWAIEQVSPVVANFLKDRIVNTPATMWESMEIYVAARSPLECVNN